MKTTKLLYVNEILGLSNFALSGFVFCIFVFCKSPFANATEISPLFGVGQENFTFTVANALPKDKEITFEPNISGVTRLGLNVFDFSIGSSFRSSGADLDPNKGTTTFFDLQLGYHKNNWGLDLFYQTYKGFFTSNTNAIQLFPDLNFIHHGLMSRYALNDSEFSIGGLMDQSEKVTQTASKVYVIGGFREHSMETPISLLQQENSSGNTDLQTLRKLKVNSFNLGLGAGKYWVNDSHFFAGGLVDLLSTFGLYEYTTTNDLSKSSYATISYDLKVALGYAGDTYKVGVSYTADSTTLRAPGTTFLKPTANRGLIYFRFAF